MSSSIPVGASVLAKWPSTSNYYKARVIDHTEECGYVCQFMDGSVIALPAKYVDLPEKFQRTPKRAGLMHDEQMFLDRSLTFHSMLMSLIWIALFLYVQHWFHHHPDLDGSAASSGHIALQQYPAVVIQSLLLWFALQYVIARFVPSMDREPLTYVKESHPNVSYQHRSNSLFAFAITSVIMCFARDKLPLRELTKSYYLLALFSLGIALALSLALLSKKLLAGYSSTRSQADRTGKSARFDFHLFLSIRPGIILWPALNLLLLLSIVKYNRRLSIRLLLSIVLQTVYIVNVFINETSMIRQSLDVSPPSSFDALFTNLCWVPFTATLTSVGSLARTLHSRCCSVLHWQESSTGSSIGASSQHGSLRLWLRPATSRCTSTNVNERHTPRHPQILSRSAHSTRSMPRTPTRNNAFSRAAAGNGAAILIY